NLEILPRPAMHFWKRWNKESRKKERKNEDSKESKQDADIQNEEKPTRQRRIAAINADLKRQSMIDQL
ncbi:Hypothetical predicted protein, partial [Paramuricea clavata]